MQAACYNQGMLKKPKRRKQTVSIRIDQDTYKALRRIAYRTDMKIMHVLRAQYVADLPVRRGV